MTKAAKTAPLQRSPSKKDGETQVAIHDLYPSKEALDGAIASGSTGGLSETFEQLDELLVTTSAGRS